MIGQIEEIVRLWRTELSFDGCGIGFGGPVDFAAQRDAVKRGTVDRWHLSFCIESVDKHVFKDGRQQVAAILRAID